MNKTWTLSLCALAAGTVLAPAAAQNPARSAASVSAIPPADAWEIGPIINGGNRSWGMPITPTQIRGGWYFDFPNPGIQAGHVHYVTFHHGSLRGKSRIMMRYRINADRGVRFKPVESDTLPATISLYFQRHGDRWTGKGRYAHYRWYAPAHTVKELGPGEYVMSAELDDPEWISIWARNAGQDHAQFADAKDNAGRIGFVIGAIAGRGHGAYATGPARFTLLDFRVE